MPWFYTRYISVLGFLVCFIMTLFRPAFAQTGMENFFKDVPDEPWHIVSDEITYDNTGDRYIASGNVAITKQNRKLTADHVRFDQKTMKVDAEGHVTMTAGEDVLTGDRMLMDLNSETGTIIGGSIFLKESHFYIKGEKIEKIGENTYTGERVSVTTCDGDRPDWKITGRRMKVTIDGYGTIQYMAFRVNDVPVLGSPYFIFPAKVTRQSGLLMPQISFSDRKGTVYEQPLYWAINESSDATFYDHHMSFRGEKIGAEYRYVLSEKSKGTIMFDYLDDDEVDDGTPGSDAWGYDDEDDEDSDAIDEIILRSNKNRYWFRMKHDQDLPYDFFAKLDLDIASDQDYLREFKRGYTGFEKTDAYYTDEFGRTMDDYSDTTRLNRLNINRRWTHYTLNTDFKWYDDIINWEDENGGEPTDNDRLDTTIQRLPTVEFNGFKQRIMDSGFYFDLDSEYTYFYRKDSQTTYIPKCHRADIYPRIYWPYRFRNYFNFEPSIGVRKTMWHVSSYGDATTEERWDNKDDTPPEEDFHRELYDIKLDLSTDIFNMFDMNGGGTRIKHNIRPQIVYTFIPDREEEQKQYPSFDGIDRIPRKNLITYSLTNTFTSRKAKSDNYTENRRASKKDYVYHEFCRFKIEQSYDIDEANNNYNVTDDIFIREEKFRNDMTRQPFYPIYMELELNPDKYVRIDADAEWTQYEKEFLSSNISAGLSDCRGDRLFAEYRYRRDPLESIYRSERAKIEAAGLTLEELNLRKLAITEDFNSSESIYSELELVVTENLMIYSAFERDIYDGENITASIGFLYKTQCWSFDASYTDGEDDRVYSFLVTLYGLGGLGTDIAGHSFENPTE